MSATEELKRPWLGIRHLQAALLFLNILVMYMSRFSISVAVVAMTNAASTNADFQEFDWNESEKSYILSSFFWGFVVTQFPGGYLSLRFGSKITLFGATLLAGICCIVTPLSLPSGGWQAFCALRVLLGLCQGLVYASVHAHLAKWCPRQERNRLGAFAHSGGNCGAVMTTAVSGVIAASPLGWPGIFYVNGAVCFVWCILWLLFAANNPPASRFISMEEREYIEASLQRTQGFHQKKIPIPWKAIFTSVPFLSMVLVRALEQYGVSVIVLQIPSYLHGVLQLEIVSNSLYSSLPLLINWACTYVCLITADILMSRKTCSLTLLRKTFNTIGLWIPAAGLIGLGFIDGSQMGLAIAVISITFGMNAASTIGSTLNTMDLSPNHAGILMGIVSMAAALASIAGPLIVGVIVTDQTDRLLWQIVFATAAVIFFFGNLVYIIWGSTATQPWDAEDYLQQRDAERSDAPPVEKNEEERSAAKELATNGSNGQTETPPTSPLSVKRRK